MTGVTAAAFGLDMFAAQRILCVAIVIEGDRLPFACGMAAVASLAEVSFVFVILFVTTNTGCLQLFLIEDALVTRLAFGCPVFARQPVFRVPVVIEANRLPVAIRMTGIAAFAKATFVFIVLLVARHAGGWCTFEFGILVAVATLDVDVLAA